MPEPRPELRPPLWWRRKWVTLSEVVGVGALCIAALSFCDTRRIHREEQAERSSAARQQVQRQALVLKGQPVDNGARLMLTPVREEQVVQSQRYLFPRPVLDHPMQVDAAPPQVQVAWVQDGLRQELRAVVSAQHLKLEGFGRLPVGMVTTYVEDGETRTDRSIYLVGYRIAPGGLFGGSPRVFFQGLEIAGRGAGADLQARVDARWKSEPKLWPAS